MGSALVCVVLGVEPKFEPNKFGGVGKKKYPGAPRPEWAVAALVDGVPWGEEHLHTLYTHSHNTMSGVEFRGAFTSQTRNGTSLCDG